MIACVFLAWGCAKERPVEPVLANGTRIEKTDLNGTYLFAKTVTTANFTAGSDKFEDIPVGRYVKSNLLVQFKINEKSLDVVAVDPLFKDEQAALQSTLLARFPVKHVDVLRKQNEDGDDTHEEEETDTRRPWQERSYVIVDILADAQDLFAKDTKSASGSENIEIDRERGAINFSVSRAMNDDSEIEQRYSFLKFQPSSTYVQQEYPRELQNKFGFFKTQTLKFDAYGRITQSNQKEYINRWDTSKKVVYYLSPNYPPHLIQPTKDVFASWNESFKMAVGHDVLEVRENTGQQLGDLRYSMITYDETVDAPHGILGYGPSYTNPRTGEIIKADVILFGGVLRNSVYKERILQKLLEEKSPAVAAHSEEALVQAANKNLLRSRMGMELLDTKLLSRVSTLVSKRTLDEELLHAARETYNPRKAVPQLRQQLISELSQNTTRLNEEASASLVEGVKNSQSDEEIEMRIFLPLLTHELGHNFGLRHNFMGSLDKRHFENGKQTASVMDYVLLYSHASNTPAAYDRAAILVAYSNAASEKKTLLSDNYFFCTDESVLSSQTAYCNQFDVGTSLTEITSNLYKRYQASWAINNNRLNRVYFHSFVDADYHRRIMTILISLRNIYDHTSTLAKAIEENNIGQVWFLSRQRVEAEFSSEETELSPEKKKLLIEKKKLIPIKVSAGSSVEGEHFQSTPSLEEKIVDPGKVASLLLDAKIARTVALQSLREIILNTDHPDYAETDLAHGDLQVRGVLFDKIMAMNILAAKLPSPLGDGTVSTTFPEGDDEPVLPTLFRQIVSNVILSGEAGSPASPEAKAASFDINLREMALILIKEELSDSGLASVMKGVLATELTRPDQTEDSQKALLQFESEMRNTLRQIYADALSPEQQKEALQKLSLLVSHRNQSLFFAQTKQLVGERVYRAPLVLPEVGLITATGLFIRDTINPYEQMGDAMAMAAFDLKQIEDAEMAKPEGERKKDVIAASQQKRMELIKSRLLLGQIVESQRAFLDRIYRAYDPQ